jgi:hypothetical protein
MPYPAGHRAKIRQKIVQAARRLFNQRGFESVSINEIMGAAGLTRGGFYSYFAGKTELYAETLACFFTDPTWKNTWKGGRDRPQRRSCRAANSQGLPITPAFRERQGFVPDGRSSQRRRTGGQSR